MAKIQPYTHEDFFKEISNLESKTLLDVGAGFYPSYSIAYLSHLDNQKTRTQEGLDEKKYQESEFVENVVAVDLKYKGEFSSLLSNVSLRADVRKLPFNDKSFDIVSVGWLLDLFDDSELDQVVNESIRVLKSGGYLIGDVPLHPGKLEKYTGLFGGMKLLKDGLSYSKQRKKYQKIMENEGLEFLKNGFGFIINKFPIHLTFYFITQKR